MHRIENRELLSIIVPVFNEEENVLPFYSAVNTLLTDRGSEYLWEIIFTDNHSSDRTFEMISRIARDDTRIRCVRFSKNVGYQKSILAGYLLASGASAIQMDCDLQDPPSLIFDFIREWKCGAKVVFGIRTRRREFFLLEASRRIFYRLVLWLSGGEIPVDAGDFRLVDRVILAKLASYKDESPYLRGFIARLGFRQIGISYERSKRERGTSKFNFAKLVSLAIDGVLSTSVLPLRVATLFGLLVSAAAIFLSICYTFLKIFVGSNWPAGFTTLAILILLSTGINALFLGIIGEYIARIFRQAKSFDEVTVESSVGFPKPEDLSHAT